MIKKIFNQHKPTYLMWKLNLTSQATSTSNEHVVNPQKNKKSKIGNISNSLRLLCSHSATNYCLGCIALHSLRESTVFSFRRVKNKTPDNNSSECFQIIRVVTMALGFLCRLVYFPL